MTIREEAFAGLPVSCPVIDAHTHIGPYHMSGWHQKYDRTDTAPVLEDLNRIGIDCIVTAPHPMVQERMAEANKIAAEMAETYPGKVYGYISIVPPCGMDAVKKELETYRDNPTTAICCSRNTNTPWTLPTRWAARCCATSTAISPTGLNS